MTRERNDAGGDADKHTDERYTRERDTDLEQDEAWADRRKPDFAAILKTAALQAHADYCLTHNIPQQSVQDAFNDVFRDGQKEQNCAGHFSQRAKGYKY